eukprot:gene7752-1389_t
MWVFQSVGEGLIDRIPTDGPRDAPGMFEHVLFAMLVDLAWQQNPPCGCTTTQGCCCNVLTNYCFTNTLDPGEAEDFTDSINAFRTSLITMNNPNNPPAPPSQMLPLTWDPNLSSIAQWFSDSCVIGSSTDFQRASAAGEPITELVYITSGPRPNPYEVIQFWSEQLACYTWDGDGDGLGDGGYCSSDAGLGCNGDCGAYRQLAWSDTNYVGCAINACPVPLVDPPQINWHPPYCATDNCGEYTGCTCADGLQNCDEVSVDCGGSCSALCTPCTSPGSECHPLATCVTGNECLCPSGFVGDGRLPGTGCVASCEAIGQGCVTNAVCQFDFGGYPFCSGVSGNGCDALADCVGPDVCQCKDPLTSGDGT